MAGSRALAGSHRQNHRSSDGATPHHPKTAFTPQNQPGPGCTRPTATLLLSECPLSAGRWTETPHADRWCRGVLPARLCLFGCVPCWWPVPSVPHRSCFASPSLAVPVRRGQDSHLGSHYLQRNPQGRQRCSGEPRIHHPLLEGQDPSEGVGLHHRGNRPSLGPAQPLWSTANFHLFLCRRYVFLKGLN